MCRVRLVIPLLRGSFGRTLSLVALSLAIGGIAAVPVHGESFTEEWYMRRGKSNLRIHNYRNAAEAFEKVVEKNPDNREALLALAQSYEAAGLTERALSLYDRYLDKFGDDAEVAFAQAERMQTPAYAYRRRDALKYYRQGLNVKNDNRQRLRYANMLGERRETVPEAITQYEKVVRKEPYNAEAHFGLGRAYAWLGEPDKALYHTQLAARYQPRQAGLRGLERDLMQGREPQLGANMQFFTQGGSDLKLNGFSAGLNGRRELTAFMSGWAEGGFGHYWRGGTYAGGPYGLFKLQRRTDPTRRLDAQLGVAAFGDSGTARLGLQYGREIGNHWLRLGYRYEPRFDSYLSLVGETLRRRVGRRIEEKEFGAARANDFYAELGGQFGATEITLAPSVGWVKAKELSANFATSAVATARRTLVERSSSTWGAQYALQVSHYGRDQSGVSWSASGPEPGGYFSPDLFVNNTPKVFWKAARRIWEWELLAGPSFQYVKTSASEFQVGGEADLFATCHVTPKLSARFNPGFLRVADVYNRFYLNAFLTYTF